MPTYSNLKDHLEKCAFKKYICNKINCSQSAVSHQLRILKSSKLVKYRKDGNLIYYALDDDHVKKIFELGCEHINEI